VHDKTIRRRRIVLGVLVALSLILLSAYFGESPSSPLHAVQRGVVAVLSPIQTGASKVLSPVRDIAGFVSSTINAKAQNAQLKKQVADLRQSYDQLLYQQSQYQQLSSLQKLDTANKISTYSPVTASVIGKNPVLWYDTIEVDAGSAQGVHQYDPVIGDGGLVGDVTVVDGNYSIVTLLTSPRFAVGAMVLTPSRLSYSGVLQPKVGNPQQLLLNYLPSTAQIGAGDAVVTSGFTDTSNSSIRSLYPPGIPIGTISTSSTQIQDSLVNSQQLDVSPVVDLQHLSVVQILTHPHPTTQSAALP